MDDIENRVDDNDLEREEGNFEVRVDKEGREKS